MKTIKYKNGCSLVINEPALMHGEVHYVTRIFDIDYETHIEIAKHDLTCAHLFPFKDVEICDCNIEDNNDRKD